MWIWVVYRISDAALVLAAVVMHHLTGEGRFNQMFGSAPWPDGVTTLSESLAYAVGGLLPVEADPDSRPADLDGVVGVAGPVDAVGPSSPEPDLGVPGRFGDVLGEHDGADRGAVDELEVVRVDSVLRPLSG